MISGLERNFGGVSEYEQLAKLMEGKGWDSSFGSKKDI